MNIIYHHVAADEDNRYSAMTSTGGTVDDPELPPSMRPVLGIFLNSPNTFPGLSDIVGSSKWSHYLSSR